MNARITIAALALVAACTADQNGPTGGSAGQLTLVNAAGATHPVTLYVDGTLAGSVGTGAQSQAIALTPGEHAVDVRHEDGSAGFSRTIAIRSGAATTIVAYDSSGLLRPAALDDSNAVVPPGSSKLRVANFAQSAGSIDIWRTQPDYGTPIRVMFPFAYGAVSPYLESGVGSWQVLVSTPIAMPNGPMPDTLAASGHITIAGGDSRTVVVTDRAGGGLETIVLDR